MKWSKRSRLGCESVSGGALKRPQSLVPRFAEYKPLVDRSLYQEVVKLIEVHRRDPEDKGDAGRMDDIEVRDAASSLSLTPSTRVAFIRRGRGRWSFRERGRTGVVRERGRDGVVEMPRRRDGIDAIT